MAASGSQRAECFESSLRSVLPKFGLRELYNEQMQALYYLVSGNDVFANLPTGFGKSLIYQLAPFVVEEMSRREGKPRTAIVLVISPLVSLIKDQVNSLRKKGIKASYRWWTGRGKFTKNHQGWHEDCVLVSWGHVGQRWMARNGLLPDLPTKCCCCGRRWSTLHHSLVRNLSLFCCCRHTCHLDRIISSIFLKSMEIHRAGIVSILNAALCSISGAKVEIPATLLSGDGTTTFRSWDRSYQVTHLLLPWLPLRWKQPEKKFAMPWTWPVQNLLWSPLKGVIFHIQWLECQTPFMWPNILIGFFKWSGPKAGSVRGSLSTARLSTNAVAYFRCSLSALAPKFTCMKKTQAPKRDLLKWCMQGPQTMLKSPFSIHWQLTMAT